MENDFNDSSQQSWENQPTNPTYPPRRDMVPKNIGLCILFSLITCGIYGLYWLYCMTEDLNTLSGDTKAMSGGMVVILTVVTCGIYGWFWLFKSGEFVEQVRAAQGLPRGYSDILYLVLGIFGCVIISWALLQNEINKMIAM